MKRAMASLSIFILTATSALAGGMCGAGGGAQHCSHGGSGAGLKSLLFFAALYGGYWVLRQAEAEKTKLLRVVGRIVAWIILLGGLGGLLCGFCSPCRSKRSSSMCATGGMKAAACPYTAPASTVEAPADPVAPELALPAKKKK